MDFACCLISRRPLLVPSFTAQPVPSGPQGQAKYLKVDKEVLEQVISGILHALSKTLFCLAVCLLCWPARVNCLQTLQ